MLWSFLCMSSQRFLIATSTLLAVERALNCDLALIIYSMREPECGSTTASILCQRRAPCISIYTTRLQTQVQAQMQTRGDGSEYQPYQRAHLGR